MGFESEHLDLSGTELWKILKDRTRKEKLSDEFVVGVGEICSHGIKLAKDIIRFFPTFTLHDITHIYNVCDWMVRLLGDRKKELTAEEAALLLLSACCHDIGMSVSNVQREEFLDNTRTPEWRSYFKANPKDDAEFYKTGKVSERMLRSFVRMNHHKRVANQLEAFAWPNELSHWGIDCETLIRLCQSHGEPIDELMFNEYDSYTNRYDLRLCAVLLRIADILDFDASRAPADLYQHLGLGAPATAEDELSQTEWDKNCTPHSFGQVTDGVLPFKATCTNMQIEHEVRSYMNWIQQELDSCSKYLARHSGRWSTFRLPYKLSVTITPKGYKSGDFRLTMDQDRILKLLVGRNLYSDPGVFVRELLQNAIDAVLTRGNLDPYFDIGDGKIVIHTWMDSDGNSWFRIEDNGIGMDEHIITNYFLKVGRSYYDSDEFKADKRQYGRGSDYTPISHFGIGILSCFMSDPEHNVLEVSTKRFSRDPGNVEPAVRLNVTGLYGYYYLAVEGEQRAVQPMHHPASADKGYRTDIGTTICVRMNLYQQVNYRSFREIVDRYVQFPEVAVEYYGPEGHICYPMEHELMNSIHTLNLDGPGMPPKEYVHPLPGHLLTELKLKMPRVSWTKEPELVIQYYPLDWVSKSKKINGVAVFAHFRVHGSSNSLWYEGKKFKPELEFSFWDDPHKHSIILRCTNKFPDEFRKKMQALEQDISSSNLLELKSQVCQEQKRFLEQYYELSHGHDLIFSYTDILKQADSFEASVFKFVKDKGKYGNTITAYNGVLADTEDLLDNSTNCLGIILLLRDDYRPEVNLARDVISHLPLEAACDLALLQRRLPYSYHYTSSPSPLRDQQFALLSEQELRHLVNSHSDWEIEIDAWLDSCGMGRYSIKELQQAFQHNLAIFFPTFNKDSLYDKLCLTVLKQRYSVYMNTSDARMAYVIDTPADNSTVAFPVSMFFSSEGSNHELGQINGIQINYYNKKHRFSLWLIQHQAKLQKLVPAIYNSLLKIMVLAVNTSEVREGINAILSRLREYHHNLFEISDDIFIKDDDF